MRDAAKVGGEVATHNRWHVARGRWNPMCPLCWGDRPPQPPQRRMVRRVLSLRSQEIETLQQLTARIEAVDPHADELFVARVAMLTEFLHDLLGTEKL